ncbi:Gfo/Idh/MocA family protein [Rhodopirellula sallentina]|uniref:Oxidoreductase domain-containing protein n=1 Tax=Rhodopirellula sallentina SM41 TaxID=1263870 RepID=M5TS03_9BACT|nr:Gfo/Idh/MocA family oxidoreductase [Rhodopirellula sallentina]EMI51967.1 oxidoreductase domain-containing protein [Rhodopirellula sallentina SM41]
MNREPMKIAMHGVTGRMGTNQHFIRSILAIMRQGGVTLSNGDVQPIEPILVGRNEDKLRHLAENVAQEKIGRHIEWTTDLESVLSDDNVDIFFDAASTQLRPEVLKKAMHRGKAVYCEKPIATELDAARELADIAAQTEVKNGAVQDKLWLPGIRKLRMLRDQGFFGDLLSVRAEFGYWVFTGHTADQPAQRPSWNYRSEDGGGMMIDMFCHWEYLIKDLFGPVDRVLAHALTDIPERIDETGRPFPCTADDAAYAIFVLENGVTCQFNSSWTTRVRRDDLLTIQVDGTKGSAVAGLRECWIQNEASTPKPTWNPDVPQPINFYDNWQQIPNNTEYDNAFKIQWELFIRHCADDGDFPWSLVSAAAGVQLAEAGVQSVDQKAWVSLKNTYEKA